MKHLLSLILLLCSVTLWAEDEIADSQPLSVTQTENYQQMRAALSRPITLELQSPYTVTYPKDENYKKPAWYKTNVMRGIYIGAPLIASSFIFKSIKGDFRSIRSNLDPNVGVKWDDFTQYAPMAACYIMKAAGVESRTSWGRMMTSHALAAASMAALVNGMKYPIGELRPDGSTKNSFPSGHTATAFMAATLLHREYGHVSPWISVGAYTLATATGIGRVINNRHWVSDVMCGAGIGIITGELGYYLGDLIFGDKYVRHFKEDENYDRWHNPSYLSINVGSTLPIGHLETTEYDEILETNMHYGLKFLSGSDASVEGAYFATPYFGFGGSMHIVSSNLALKSSIDSDIEEAKLLSKMYSDEYIKSNCNLSMQNYSLNVYGSYPFSKIFRMQAKFSMGYSHSKLRHDSDRASTTSDAIGKWYDRTIAEHRPLTPAEQNIVDLVKETYMEENIDIMKKYNEMGSMENVLNEVDKTPDFDNVNDRTDTYLIGCGLSAHLMPTRHLDASLYCDWNMVGATAVTSNRLKYINVGLSAGIRF